MFVLVIQPSFSICVLVIRSKCNEINRLGEMKYVFTVFMHQRGRIGLFDSHETFKNQISSSSDLDS